MGLTVLGNASNLIVGDGGIDDLTIILTRLNKIEVHDNKVTAQAGASYIATTEAARDSELTGLEFCCWYSRQYWWGCLHECRCIWW